MNSRCVTNAAGVTETAAPAAPLQIRVFLCRGSFHVWISAGPHHPRLLCQCGRVMWQDSKDYLEQEGPPIFVNGAEAGLLDALMEKYLEPRQAKFDEFEAGYSTKAGWKLTLRGEGYAPKGEGEALSEAIEDLEEEAISYYGYQLYEAANEHTK